MNNTPVSLAARRRALRATRAVTFGGFALALGACGTEPEPGGSTGSDAGADTATDSTVSPDATHDTRPEDVTTSPDTTPPSRDAGEDSTPPPRDVGVDSTPPPRDVGVDTAPPPRDAGPDTVMPPPDVGPDADPGECSREFDNVCPEGCGTNDDADCCLAQNDEWGWCEWSPDWGCQCAVEGPFSPPTFAHASAQEH